MSIEIKVPVLPESVADGLLLDWNKQPGDFVSRDEILVEVETDKVVLEVPAPRNGVISEILTPTGAVVTSEQVLAILEESDGLEENEGTAAAAPIQPVSDQVTEPSPEPVDTGELLLGPAVRKLVEEHHLDPAKITPSGPGGRITKEDLLAYIADQVAPDEERPVQDPPTLTDLATTTVIAPEAAKQEKSTTVMVTSTAAKKTSGSREEVREPMSRLRQTIAARLVQSQQTAAMLTTFNEVNMQPVMELRSRYKEQFEKTHGTRLGFMSFFVKASVAALQKFPLVNAYVDGSDIVRHSYNDIGIAVSSPRGLVVPVLRNCEGMSFADIEARIRAYGGQARDGKIGLNDLSGGTFTITNGGVFGSMLSTPIINPPQSAILGMHNILDRPVAENGEVVIRPIMYLALSYDHRIVDGMEAVQFLVTIKDMIEDPARLLLDC